MGMPPDPLPTDDQRKALGEFLRRALVFIRNKGGAASQELADAIHNLPADSWVPGVWNVTIARDAIARYDAAHQHTTWPGSFLAMFDEIFPPDSPSE
jgi:hypothetical protein